MMDWSPDFCLACDRQTDGGLYCGESCRLSEYERANCSSMSSSPASSPTYQLSSPPAWSTSPSPKTAITRSNFYLPPAYDFSTFRKPSPSASTRFLCKSPVSSPFSAKLPALTSSSSQSSLASLNSLSSTSDSQPAALSAESQRELRNYASSFDQSRYSRRQSA